MTTQPTNAADQAAQLIAGDAAQITPPADGDNIAAAKTKLMDQVSIYGRQAARGAASLTHLAFLFAGACRERMLTELDAEAVYTAYVKAYNDAVASHHATTGAAPLEVSKASVSVFRTFGKPAPVAQPDLYQRVLVLKNRVAADDLVGSTYNCFVAVNRAIQKVIDDRKGLFPSATLEVTDEMIVKAITKPARPDKTDADRLAQVAAALGKLVQGGRFPGLEMIQSELVKYHAQFSTGKLFMSASTVLGGVETSPTLN